MVLFQHVEPPMSEIASGEAHRALALAKGRSLVSRVMPGSGVGHVSASPPLVVLHGISRDARALWNAFGPLAAAEGRTLLVPRFSKRAWPLFQQVGPARPDLALLDLFGQAGLAGQRVDLFGFSGGAQLAHRFAMLYPQRVATLHLAAPGWYTLPDTHISAPLGLGPAQGRQLRGFDAAALSRLQLTSFLSLKVRLWVGALDIGRDASLRQTPVLDALQGRTRLERASHYAETFARAARTRGIDPDISLTVLPGCGHDFTDCARTGGLAEHVLAGG
ncbi:MAG: alpha/beta hydrolase [Tabrizicola sp.]|jgi:pimeloyl-ACP methyl ester carboxylesterase|nr:alpha/beta hydrolase [Tabrizicola sp.]